MNPIWLSALMGTVLGRQQHGVRAGSKLDVNGG